MTPVPSDAVGNRPLLTEDSKMSDWYSKLSDDSKMSEGTQNGAQTTQQQLKN